MKLINALRGITLKDYREAGKQLYFLSPEQRDFLDVLLHDHSEGSLRGELRVSKSTWGWDKRKRGEKELLLEMARQTSGFNNATGKDKDLAIEESRKKVQDFLSALGGEDTDLVEKRDLLLEEIQIMRGIDFDTLENSAGMIHGCSVTALEKLEYDCETAKIDSGTKFADYTTATLADRSEKYKEYEKAKQRRALLDKIYTIASRYNEAKKNYDKLIRISSPNIIQQKEMRSYQNDMQRSEDQMQALIDSHDQKLENIQEKIDEKAQSGSENIERLRRKSEYMKRHNGKFFPSDSESPEDVKKTIFGKVKEVLGDEKLPWFFSVLIGTTDIEDKIVRWLTKMVLKTTSPEPRRGRKRLGRIYPRYRKVK